MKELDCWRRVDMSRRRYLHCRTQTQFESQR